MGRQGEKTWDGGRVQRIITIRVLSTGARLLEVEELDLALGRYRNVVSANVHFGSAGYDSDIQHAVGLLLRDDWAKHVLFPKWRDEQVGRKLPTIDVSAPMPSVKPPKTEGKSWVACHHQGIHRVYFRDNDSRWTCFYAGIKPCPWADDKAHLCDDYQKPSGD